MQVSNVGPVLGQFFMGWGTDSETCAVQLCRIFIINVLKEEKEGGKKNLGAAVADTEKAFSLGCSEAQVPFLKTSTKEAT